MLIVLFLVYSVAVKYDGEDVQVQVDSGSWQVIKAQRVEDGVRLKIRANIDNNISTYNANIDGASISLFLEVSLIAKICYIFNTNPPAICLERQGGLRVGATKVLERPS